MNLRDPLKAKDIKLFLFEKIHPRAKEVFESAGLKVTVRPKAPSEGELSEILEEAHLIGVRSRSQILPKHLKEAKNLLGIGCFTVGTDQVDLAKALSAGIPVFNAPHSSTRSVAELTISNVIALARKSAELSHQLHLGKWKKSASGVVEVRNKTIGLIGYGHIGKQVGLLAEALGMNVIFFDITKTLPLGRVRQVDSLDTLLKSSDFVSLHVPSTDETTSMIDSSAISKMKDGAYLLNLARGTVVDIPALAASLRDKKLAGAALDVYPEEPATAEAEFSSELIGLENVLLTPHIGGSTEEAQKNIGEEVALALLSYLEEGSTDGSVNFPNVKLAPTKNTHRILYIHKNEPGALAAVNSMVSELGINITSQVLSTRQDIGYLLFDTDSALSKELKDRISKLPRAIKTRILY